MDLMKEFESVAKEFAEFRKTLEQTKSQPMDDQVRQYLDEATQSLDEQMAIVKKTLPQAIQEIGGIRANAETTMKAATDKLAAVHQRMAEMEKEEAAAAAAAAAALAAGPKLKPPVVVDPLVGGQLRGELLSLYGLKVAAAAGPANAGSIWRILDDVKEKEPEPLPPPEPPKAEEPASAPPPKKKKETGSFKGLDIFDNLSQLGDE